MIPRAKIPIRITVIVLRTQFMGRQTSITTIKLTVPPTSRLNMYVMVGSSFQKGVSTWIVRRHTTIASACGSAIRKTWRRKPPPSMLSFCSSVSKKLGTPIAMALIQESWMGIKGYSLARRINSTQRITE